MSESAAQIVRLNGADEQTSPAATAVFAQRALIAAASHRS